MPPIEDILYDRWILGQLDPVSTYDSSKRNLNQIIIRNNISVGAISKSNIGNAIAKVKSDLGALILGAYLKITPKPETVVYFYKRKSGNRESIGEDKYISFSLDLAEGVLFIIAIKDTVNQHHRLDAPIPLAGIEN